MKNARKYFNSFYPPAFLTLCIGLAIFSLAITILAVNLHMDLLAEKTDIIYRYPKMIEEILFPLYILLPVIFVVDLNERKIVGK